MPKITVRAKCRFFFVSALFASLIVFTSPSLAHEGHPHPEDVAAATKDQNGSPIPDQQIEPSVYASESAEEEHYDQLLESTKAETQTYTATITKVLSEEEIKYPDGTATIIREFEIKIAPDQGLPENKSTISVIVERLKLDNAYHYDAGQKVIVNRIVDFAGNESFYLADHYRIDTISMLFLLFVVLILSIAHWHGVRSLFGLASSYLIIFKIVLPMIEHGYNPIVTSIVGAFLIMIFTFFLSHGFSTKTATAVAGTTLSLILTGICAALVTHWAKLTGFANEESVFLQLAQGPTFNARGLMLCGIIIGALGVLDDITISQASVVEELRQLNPKLSTRKLFLKAMNVGKDHIASLVNTLILVYTGSSLPLLLLFRQNLHVNPIFMLNYEIVAQEIVTTIVGSIGLVLAVPITTFLASYLHFKVDETSEVTVAGAGINIPTKKMSKHAGHRH